jgi:hypothetical protein
MEAGGRLKVRSAINSMLWLCGIITTPCLLVYGVKPGASDWLLVCGLAPEAAAIFGFIFLLIFDRPYLQSEDFQIRKMEIEMIEEKGRPAIEAASVDGLVLKAEELPQLPGQVEDE